jgi:hypothetical protein
MPDRQIARLLNRTRVETGHGNAWTQERVRGFRNHHDIAVFVDDLAAVPNRSDADLLKVPCS